MFHIVIKEFDQNWITCQKESFLLDLNNIRLKTIGTTYHEKHALKVTLNQAQDFISELDQSDLFLGRVKISIREIK